MLEKYDYRSPAQVRRPRAGRGGVEANTVKPLSKNPEAVQHPYATAVTWRRLIAVFYGAASVATYG